MNEKLKKVWDLALQVTVTCKLSVFINGLKERNNGESI